MRARARVAGLSVSSPLQGTVAVLACLLLSLPAACGGEVSRPSDTSVSTAPVRTTEVPVTTTPVTTTSVTTTLPTTTPPPSGIPLIVDTDLAVDSVMSLLYLFGRPDVRVEAITVSGTGEVHCGPGAEIAAGLVALVGREGIPVACGPGMPLEGSNAFPAAWRSAADEAWGLDLPVGEQTSELSAPDLLVSVLASSGEPVAVLTDGPLTNLAAALRLDPGIAERITMVYVMGGAVDVPGNTLENPDAEYNIWVDPTAAAEVLVSGLPVTLVPLDATDQVPLESRHIRALEKHAATPAATAVLTMLQSVDPGGLFFWDQLAAAVLVDESLAEFETLTLAVKTDGGPGLVGTTRRAVDGSEVRVATVVDAMRFEREFLSTLAGEDVGPVEESPKSPATDVEDLLTALFAAAGASDADAWTAVSMDDAVQSTYLVSDGVGTLVETSPMSDWDPQVHPLQGSIDVLGEPLVVGDAAAVAVRYSSPEKPARGAEGFVVIIGDRDPDGLLVAGAAGFFGSSEQPADAALVQEIMEDHATAWNSGDIDGVMATMSDDVVLWGDIRYPETMDSGPAVREMISEALWLHVDIGPPVTSGPFAVVPARFTADATEGSLGVIDVLWIRDGRIATMAVAEGGLDD